MTNGAATTFPLFPYFRIRIADGGVIDGRPPIVVPHIVKERTALHHDAPMRNWQAARSHNPIERRRLRN